MSKAKLKKHLLSLTKEQITDIVLELYDARKEAKDYLEFYLAPDCNAELEKSKKPFFKIILKSLKKVEKWFTPLVLSCQVKIMNR